VTAAQHVARHHRVTVRLAVMLSLAMAVAATASTLALLHLLRPFLASRGGVAPEQYQALFAAALVTGLMSALVGLGLGIMLSRRIWALVRRTDAAAVGGGEMRNAPSSDELGALDAAVGRLTLSMDRFVTDSDILARLPAAMLMVDDAGHLRSFNTTAEKLLDLPLAAYRGAPLLGADGILPRAAGNEPLERMLAAADDQGLAHADEVAMVTATGRHLLLEVTLQRHVMRDHGAGAVLLLRDSSEKRRIRKQIKKADHLALLGGMAARLAHEVRTPLAAVRGLVELLQSDLPQADRSHRYVGRILDALDRQDQLVDKLLTLTHPQPERYVPVAMRDLLGELISAWPGPPPMLVVEGGVGTVPGDSILLTEVFTNLIRNAVEASGTERVVVTMSGEESVVRVTISNYGVGIAGELHERIFQPFFTTKPRGTGLGLAIARQLVDAHHGAIRVESNGRTETHFIVELPAVRETQPALVHA
jgi:signal transduction histidine kinase